MSKLKYLRAVHANYLVVRFPHTEGAYSFSSQLPKLIHVCMYSSQHGT